MRPGVIAQAEDCVITPLESAVASTVITEPSASIRLCWVKPLLPLLKGSKNSRFCDHEKSQNFDFVTVEL